MTDDQRPLTVEIAFHGYVRALEAEVRRLRDQPDRGEMVERGAKALAARAGDESVFGARPDLVIAEEYRDDARAVLDAALGPATDQELEGT